MSSIPASYSVISQPSVLNQGGNALNLNGLCISENARIPIGQVLSFLSGAAVTSYFGTATNESVIANGGQTLSGNPAGQGYFGGSIGATATPGALLFARYPATAVAAFMRGGNAAAALTLAALQALSGSLTVVMDGYSHVISSISLAADNSFSAAAAAIQAAFTDPTEASFTASIGGSGTTCTTTGTTLTMGALAAGYFSVGDVVAANDGTNSLPAGTTILAQLTGTPGGSAGATFTISAAATPGNLTSTTVTASSTILDVTVDSDHAIAAGQTVTGSGVAANTLIVSQISGTIGGIGFYRISGAAQHVASEAMTGVATAPLVTFDSVSGGFVITSGITGAPSTAAFATGTLAAPLLLTSATGAVLSQGAAATTPAAFMASILNLTTNWATFFTAFDPDGGSGNVQKLAYAAWTNSVAPRYAYLGWDTDSSPGASEPASASFGYQVTQTLQYSGTVPIYEPSDLNHAAFVSGAIAAVDFTAPGGRTTMAYRTQSGLGAAVTDIATATNLGGNPLATGSFGNGYNFVGFFSLPNQNSINFQRGTISGPYQWIDAYINQIWLSAQFQSAAYNYMLAVKSFPYTPSGYANFELAMSAVIQAGLIFGAYSAGVILSAAQISEVNAAAGANIAGTLQAQGYYFQVLDPGAIIRASRGSPVVTFWYVDGGSVQSLSIGSVNV
jgi:hypothetical protein